LPISPVLLANIAAVWLDLRDIVFENGLRKKNDAPQENEPDLANGDRDGLHHLPLLFKSSDGTVHRIGGGTKPGISVGSSRDFHADELYHCRSNRTHWAFGLRVFETESLGKRW
jgi:hypothetical protein